MKWLCSYTCYEVCYDNALVRDPNYRLCDCLRLHLQIKALQSIGAIIHDPTDPANVYYDEKLLRKVLAKLGISEREFWEDPITTCALIKG